MHVFMCDAGEFYLESNAQSLHLVNRLSICLANKRPFCCIFQRQLKVPELSNYSSTQNCFLFCLPLVDCFVSVLKRFCGSASSFSPSANDCVCVCVCVRARDRHTVRKHT
jgi:hypothetical protein